MRNLQSIISFRDGVSLWAHYLSPWTSVAREKLTCTGYRVEFLSSAGTSSHGNSRRSQLEHFDTHSIRIAAFWTNTLTSHRTKKYASVVVRRGPLNSPSVWYINNNKINCSSHFLNQSTEILEQWRPLYSPPLSPLLLPSLRYGVNWCQEFQSDGHFLRKGVGVARVWWHPYCATGLRSQEHAGRSRLFRKGIRSYHTAPIRSPRKNKKPFPPTSR